MNAEQKLNFPDDVARAIRTAYNERGVTEWQDFYPSCPISDRPKVNHIMPKPVYTENAMWSRPSAF